MNLYFVLFHTAVTFISCIMLLHSHLTISGSYLHREFTGRITSDFLFILLCTKPKIQLNFLVILYINKIKLFYILLSLDFVL